MSVMPKRMQVMKLKDELKRMGISSDLHDIDAHVDATLSYPENARIILKQFKNVSNTSTKSKQTKSGISNIDFAYAAKYHQARSDKSREKDERTSNKRTYTEKQIIKKPHLLNGWYKNPGSMDIMGIDAFNKSKTTHKKKRGKK